MRPRIVEKPRNQNGITNPAMARRGAATVSRSGRVVWPIEAMLEQDWLRPQEIAKNRRRDAAACGPRRLKPSGVSLRYRAARWPSSAGTADLVAGGLGRGAW